MYRYPVAVATAPVLTGEWIKVEFVYNKVGLCRLNQVDPYPITYSLSNP